MGSVRLVLGDQLTRDLAGLRDLDPARDEVLMVEVREEATYVRHHQKKIAFLFAAMRHFAADLAAEGIRVTYVRLDDPDNTGSFSGEVARAVARLRPGRLVCTHPGEWRVLQAMRGWEAALGLPVEIREDDRFLCPLDRFRAHAARRKGLRMEFFYREMRVATGLLMDEAGEPAGGLWNFDKENRQSLPPLLTLPEVKRFPPDATTREVLALVAARFGDHFGALEPFGLPVTRAQALELLEHFLAEALPRFGDFQDAMKRGEPLLFHSFLSPCLNAGLLTPREVCARAEIEYRAGRAPLNAVEGFIRQILGWREYVRGIYWLHMPEYRRRNALGAKRRLPWFYWSGETDMACVADVVATTRREAYAHHIQRLMVTGNFALIAGLDPDEVNEWYLVVYADAYEWVELPNVTGMILYADGGVMGSKPYAASGKYIDRMSDYCSGCRYDVKQATGPDACPFNFLYWDFLARHRAFLANNPRMKLILASLDRMDAEKVATMRAQAASFLDGPEMDPNPPRAPDAYPRSTS